MIDPFKIVRMVLAAMETLSAAEVEAAAQYDYSKVRQELERLDAAVVKAKGDDDAEASTFWAGLLEVVPPGPIRHKAGEALSNDATAAKAEADAARAEVHLTCARIGIHAGVPEQLMKDRATWLKNEKTTAKKIDECENQKNVDGWNDDGKVQYDLAVDVQVKALEELKGIMASAAQSCRAGALLNRAVFFVVAKAVRKATGVIGNAGGFSMTPHYRRTRAATQALRTLEEEIGVAVGGEVAAGSANALSGELRNTLTMPNLLEVGAWPTGTDKAGLDPAPTQQGVTSDGRDANLGGRK